MVKHIRWEIEERSSRELGYVGEEVFFSIEEHYRAPDAFSLGCTLPGWGGHHLHQMLSVAHAKDCAEDLILPEFLKKTGLQFKPQKAPSKKS